jgi:3-oxoacyl-[acyl-carrier-protein] synthase II
MENAIFDAGITPGEIDYINAHATGTVQGDAAEGRAIFNLFGDSTPVSSLKGHLGHTMAASGSLEIAATIMMLRGGFIIPTLNLDHIDDGCGRVRHVQRMEASNLITVMKNSFALGGINSSIVLRRYAHEGS